MHRQEWEWIQRFMAEQDRQFPAYVRQKLREHQEIQRMIDWAIRGRGQGQPRAAPVHIEIRSARRKRNWTQKMLAEKSGVSLRVINALESRGVLPTEQLLNCILEALDLSLAH